MSKFKVGDVVLCTLPQNHNEFALYYIEEVTELLYRVSMVDSSFNDPNDDDTHWLFNVRHDTIDDIGVLEFDGTAAQELNICKCLIWDLMSAGCKCGGS